MDYLKPYQSYFTYLVITPPVELPVSLADVKEHLRLDQTDTSQDDYLTFLIQAAGDFCEEYTSRTLINTGFRTFRNFFAGSIELRRSPFVQLDAFEYSVDGTFTAVDSAVYYTTQEIDFSKIILKNNSNYPSDGDEILQLVRIDFTAGYGDDSSSIPQKLRLAILNHIAALYENRGDCDNCSCADVMATLPKTSRIVYNFFRPVSIV